MLVGGWLQRSHQRDERSFLVLFDCAKNLSIFMVLIASRRRQSYARD